MSVSSAAQAPDRKENAIAGILFGALLLFHVWGTTVGWTSRNLPGCEFRQAQTAISTLFIQREGNFSLAYPTPVLGKPWSIPMEFPLYQWTVAKLSTVTGASLTETGRAVSLACFYLALPAIYLLLARLGLPRSRRLVALGMVVCCPLYIFYARAFLIETMAWMFGVWFLLAYVNAVERRSIGWLLAAAAAGTGAGLVKVTTFLFILMPAFVWTMYWFWQVRPGRPEGGWAAWARLAGWSLAAVAAGCMASVWWVRCSDAIKTVSPAGNFLTAAHMRDYNFGIGQRFDPGVWDYHWKVLFHEIVGLPVLVGAGVLLAFFARPRWGIVALLVLLFFAVQVIFPILYAWHEYYYVANTFLLMLAIGLVLVALLESRLPRGVAWLLIGLTCAGQIGVYFSAYYPVLKLWSPGGSPLTMVLHNLTDPDDVMILAGDDWNSMTPYYAERRAFMIRRNLEQNWELIHQAYGRLKGEPVTALVLYGPQRDNLSLVKLTAAVFQIDPRPVFTWANATVYLRSDLRLAAIEAINNTKPFEIELTPESRPDIGALLKREIEMTQVPPRMRDAFKYMSPEPWKYYTTFGAGLIREPVGECYTAHPDTRLWFKVPPAGAHRIVAECYVVPGAYADGLPEYDHTDGVEVTFSVEQPDGSSGILTSRMIDPWANPGDRGLQKIEYQGELAAGATVLVAIGPGPAGNYTRDWTSLRRVEIK